MSILEIKKLNKKYNEKVILKDFSLNVNSGEIISIIGPSGIGKSTLLRCINGLEKIDSGEIKINNKILNNRMTKDLNLDVGLIFQDYNLFPEYSVLQNILLSLVCVKKIKKGEAIIIAKDLLMKLNLENRISAYPCELSGGEKQRVAIARTIAIGPKIICFDEPTSALDPVLVRQVFKIIKDLSCQGKTIIIVTHDIEFAKKISDKVIELV